jgi:hypothetical protein
LKTKDGLCLAPQLIERRSEMDADHRFIPVVEDNQEEGYRDLLDFDEWPEEAKKEYKKSLADANKAQQAIMSKMLNK